MIGAVYQSDQRIVDIYKDKCTIAEEYECRVSTDEVLNYIDMISVTNRSMMNFKFQRNNKK